MDYRAWCLAGLVMVAPARAAGTANLLPDKPGGIGRPASDRAWWGPLAESPEGARAVAAAEQAMKSPMPAFDPERYLDFTTNGDRTRYQAQHSRRWGRFQALVLGECLEDRGRFLPAIGEAAASLCGDPSWILPAHDRGARVFKGAEPYADLVVACNGHQMALAAWLLEDRLPAETVALMRANVTRRLTAPVMKTIDGTASKDVLAGHGWARANHNWNAVCTSGAVGAILLTEASRETRAKAVDWAAANMDVFLSGFGRDGYCSEGVGYWNYGFGHFAVLAETLLAQTGGKLDLYRKPAVRRIAAAPSLLEIADGVYPAFADCALNARPDANLVALLRRRLEGRPFTGKPAAAIAAGGTIYQILCGLSARLEPAPEASADPPGLPLRSWFEDSGVFVARPAAPGGMAAAWKGGTNAEHHNHNDVGTTLVVWKGKPVLADPGAMVYRAETFSKDRYRLPIMSSYGHSVPVAAGFLQAAGAACRGRVLKADFKPETDTMVMDLAAAYPDSGLARLEREWIYRRDAASLSITDSFAFHEPSAFATALMGFGDWFLLDQQESRIARFLIDGGGAVLKVTVEFSAPGGWKVERVPNPGKPPPSRLGLALKNASRDGRVRMRIEPYEGAVTGIRLPVAQCPDKLADPRKAP